MKKLLIPLILLFLASCSEKDFNDDKPIIVKRQDTVAALLTQAQKDTIHGYIVKSWGSQINVVVDCDSNYVTSLAILHDAMIQRQQEGRYTFDYDTIPFCPAPVILD